MSDAEDIGALNDYVLEETDYRDRVMESYAGKRNGLTVDEIESGIETASDKDCIEVMYGIREGGDVQDIWIGPETHQILDELEEECMIKRPKTGRNVRLTRIGQEYLTVIDQVSGRYDMDF